MSTPPLIEIDDWLAPIPGDDPAGRDLSYEPEYDQIREARRSEDTSNQGDWKRETKVADWESVVVLGEECLREKTKDLQIAAWVAEALTRLHGFPGLRDGLGLLLGIQSRYWAEYYPRIEDGDLESRHGPFLFLNEPKLLPFLIRGVPLTRGLGDEDYSYFKYKESRETDNALKKNADLGSKLLAEGRITAKMFDDQVGQTPRAFLEALVGDLKQADAAFRAFDEDTDRHFGREAPSLINVGKALEDCLRLLDPILAAKRQQEPDPAPGPLAVAWDAPGAMSTAEGGQAAPSATAAMAGPSGSVMDLGRVLIEFRTLAEQFAEAGVKLEENRHKHAECQAEMRRLDAEYEEISRMIGRGGECHTFLLKILELQGRA